MDIDNDIPIEYLYEDFMQNNEDYETFLCKHFNKTFPKKLFQYINNLSIQDYAKNIIIQIQKSIELTNNFIITTSPPEIQNIKIYNIKDISKIRKLKIQDIDYLLNNIPALMPLAIMLLKMYIYLKKLEKRNTFIDSITITLDKQALLAELWDKNICSGGFIQSELNNIFPIINTYWYQNPKFQKQYEIISKLHYIIYKSIYKPIAKLEDRLVLDVNSLLDVYCFSQDKPEEFSFCCGIPDIPTVQDKIAYILYANEIKPTEDIKKQKQAKEYINAYRDYVWLKKSFKKFKFLSKYFNSQICYNKILEDIENINLNVEEYNDYIDTVKTIFKCSLNLKDGCEFLKRKTCSLNKCDSKMGFSEYVYKYDNRFYKILYKIFKIDTDRKLIKLLNETYVKDFCIRVIKTEYICFKNKSVKTISNIFADYDSLVKKYTLNEKTNNCSYRNWNLDDKEFGNYYTIEDKLIEKLEELYCNYEQYFSNKIDKQEAKIYRIIENINDLLNPKKSRRNL